MKYCAYCGNQMLDEAVICVNCGCPVTPVVARQSASTSQILGWIACFAWLALGPIVSWVCGGIGLSKGNETNDKLGIKLCKIGLIVPSVVYGLIFVFSMAVVLFSLSLAGAV